MVKKTFCAVCVFLVLMACQAGQTEPTNSQQLPQITIQTAAGSVPVFVELARTPEERARGLMFRQELAQNRGMLFVYEQDEILSFWMKNTAISLDILFIDPFGKITFIAQNTTPFSLEAIVPTEPCRYALEVNAGFVGRHHIKAGARVFLDEIVSK